MKTQPHTVPSPPWSPPQRQADGLTAPTPSLRMPSTVLSPAASSASAILYHFARHICREEYGWNIPTFGKRYRAIGEPCAICAYQREPRKLGRAANRAGAIGCGSSHLRLKADPHSQLRLIGRLIVSAFAGWSAPQPALRASAARQVTKTAFAVHEITRKTTDDCYNSHFS